MKRCQLILWCIAFFTIALALPACVTSTAEETGTDDTEGRDTSQVDLGDTETESDMRPTVVQCTDQNCNANATCDDSGNQIVCTCNPGWTGDGLLCIDINECDTNNGGCDPLTTCTNAPGTFSCGTCPAGHTGNGDIGCTDIDECATNNGGCDPLTTCTNSPGGFNCGTCPAGFNGNGDVGCTDIDECATNNGGCDLLTICTNEPGSFTCGSCPAGYTGDGDVGCTDIDECATNNGGCDPLATCTNSPGGFNCGTCPAGYNGNGDVGCTDIDECATNNGGCDPLAACTNAPGTFSCGTCPAGYTGNGAVGCTDIDECATNNGGCDPLAACTNAPGTFSCGTCPAGYTGNGAVGCTDIDECATNNGGCDPLAACTNAPGTFSCGTCPAGYTGNGDIGCTDIDECATNNGGCDPLTTCTNSPGGFNCGTCPAGYNGNGDVGCTDIDECATNNGGCDPLAACTNSPGGFNCGTCPAGYNGNGDVGCTDIDECATNNGGCDQNCINTQGSSYCGCNPGWMLNADGHTCNDNDECTIGTDECAQHCTNSPGSYTCSCDPGWELAADSFNCVDIDECAVGTDDCHDNATCTNQTDGQGWRCECSTGWTGDGVDCWDLDECIDAPCYEPELCVDAVAPQTGYTCAPCPGGLYGDGEICFERCVIHVSHSGDDSNGGFSWDTSKATLQSAVEMADNVLQTYLEIPNCEIWVASGTHYPTHADNPSKTDRLTINSDVHLYGGFAGNETERSERDTEENVVVISGDIDANGVLDSENTEVIFEVGENAIIDGVTVTNAQSHGMIITGAPVIRKCNFIENAATEDGGAIYSIGGAPIISKSYFKGNYTTSGSSWHGGGAIHIRDGAAKVYNCIFEENEARGGTAGGAVYEAGGHSHFVNCVFGNNRAVAGHGGAVMNSRSGRTTYARYTNCTFVNNEASNSGTAMYNVNAYIGVYNSVMWHDTLTENSFATAYNQNYGMIFNSILRSGRASGGKYANVSTTNPLITDTANGDWSLGTTSPGIDYGIAQFIPRDEADLDEDGNTYEIVPIDINGNPRVMGDSVDIGAFEYNDSLITGTCPIRVTTSGNDNSTGESWSTPMLTLEAALERANNIAITDSLVDECEIWLGTGTWSPAVYSSYWIGTATPVYGGFEGTETLLAERDYNTNLSVLSGENNSSHVFMGAHQFYLDGVTIENATTSAMYAYKADGEIHNCRFENNHANHGSGGAIDSTASNIWITNTDFDSNSATYHGGAIDDSPGKYATGVNPDGCLFSSNLAQNGGAIFFWGTHLASQRYMDNSFSSNSASEECDILFWSTGTTTGCRP